LLGTPALQFSVVYATVPYASNAELAVCTSTYLAVSGSQHLSYNQIQTVRRAGAIDNNAHSRACL